MTIYSGFTHWKWWCSIFFVCLPEGKPNSKPKSTIYIYISIYFISFLSYLSQDIQYLYIYIYILPYPVYPSPIASSLFTCCPAAKSAFSGRAGRLKLGWHQRRTSNSAVGRKRWNPNYQVIPLFHGFIWDIMVIYRGFYMGFIWDITGITLW